MTTDTTDPRALGEEMHTVDVPLAFYEWAATVERDVRVSDLTPFEIAALVKSLRPSSSTGEVTQEGEEEAYEIGKRDGYSDAVQEIDLATGGDGEYRYCLGMEDSERHCPDPEAMKARILSRFASPQTAGEVVELVEKLRKWADSGDMGRSPDPSDLRRKAADTIASLTAERDAALVRCEGLEKALRDKELGDA